MQQEKTIHPRGTPLANTAGMSSSLSNVENPSSPTTTRPGTTLVSLVAAKAGREVIWVAIAGIFVLVETLVFLTELPATKIFGRREAPKSARLTR